MDTVGCGGRESEDGKLIRVAYLRYLGKYLTLPLRRELRGGLAGCAWPEET